MGILCEIPYGKKVEQTPRTSNNKNQITTGAGTLTYPKETIFSTSENNIPLMTPQPPEEIPIPNKIISNKNEEEKIKNEQTENNKNKEENILPIHRREKSKISFSVNEPKELKQNKLLKTKNKNNEAEKQFTESKQEINKFIRKNKRSTTLVDKSKISQRMYLAEMQLSVSNELLVMHQKGKPTDNYRRGKLIGSGSFGSVYAAKNIIFNNMVAMKIIEKKEGKDLDDKEILNEINILKKLSHPNIVKIYEFFDTSAFYYIITEYCKCGELYSYIKNKYSENQLAVLFYQVFSGLWYLHQNNILHRDIKLENILISEKEKDLKTNEEYFWIKIIDFGTSKIFEKTKKEKTVVGSSYYIAPEVLNQNYNEKCDVWSVGVILYMTLVGRAPFDGVTDEEILKNIKNKEYNNQNPKLLECSEEVRDLLSKLLDKNVKRRYDAREAINHPWFTKFNGRKLFSNFTDEEVQPYIDNCLNYFFTSKIQSLVIAFLVHNLPNTESSKIILKMFRYFNKSGNCKLTKDELIEGLLIYRDNEDVVDRINNIYSMLDSDNNGYIEFEEFLRACIDKKEVLTDNNMKFAFKFLDRDNTGTLNASKIMEAFLTEPNPILEMTFHNTLVEVDDDGDGIIDYEQFKKLMLKTMEK